MFNKRIRNIIKGFVYSDFFSKIRRKYIKNKMQNNSLALSEKIKRIEEKEYTRKMKVAFILKYPEIWNSLKTVYESFEKDSFVELIIIAVPKRLNTEENEAYDFARQFCEKVIKCDDEHLINFEALNIDYIFYTRPYEKDYPVFLKPSIIAEYSKICYIPYGFEFVTGYHVEVEYNYNFLPYSFMTFCEGRTSYNYCKKILPENSCNNLYLMGFPRFDLLRMYENKKKNDKYTVLWTPRWSIERIANDGTSFFDFIEPLIGLFENGSMKKSQLIIRPHPLMFDNFIKNNVMSLEDINDLKNRIAKIQNICFDYNKDYLETASTADLIISDFSGMLIEFVMLNKPIIYCGKNDKFDETGRMIDSVMYHLDPDYNISNAINKYMENGDVLMKERKKVIEEIMAGNRETVGQRIVGVIKDDYKKNCCSKKNV